MHLQRVALHLDAVPAAEAEQPPAVGRVPLGLLGIAADTGEVALLVVEVKVSLQGLVPAEGGTRAALEALEVGIEAIIAA